MGRAHDLTMMAAAALAVPAVGQISPGPLYVTPVQARTATNPLGDFAVTVGTLVAGRPQAPVGAITMRTANPGISADLPG